MKKAIWIGFPLLVVVVLIGWRYVSNQKATSALAQQQGQRKGAAAPVEIAVAGPKTLVEAVETVGSAESPLKVEISPKVSGRIEWLVAREGDAVKNGAILARIDPSEQQSLVLQAQANVAEARSRLAQAQIGQGPNDVVVQTTIEQRKADLDSAKADSNQVQRNYEAQVASAESDVTDNEAKVRSASSQVDNAQAVVGREEASLANAKARKERAESLLKEGFTSEQATEDARTAYDTQLATVNVARGQLSSAREDLISAKAQLSASKNQASIAKRKGQADIAAAKAKVVSAQAALTAANSNKAQSPAYRENLLALKASVAAAEAELAQARTRLGDLNLTSSIDGTVTARNADPGSMASAGQVLLVVQSLEWLYVVGALPLEQSASVHVGQETDLLFDALPGRTFTGRITQINPAGDVQSRQFSIRIRLENPERLVRPGMFAKVRIIAKRTQAEVVVPASAVHAATDGTKTVTVVDDESKAHVITVQTGVSEGSDVQIVSGIEAGATVVTFSYQAIKDGQAVKPPGSTKGADYGKAPAKQ